MYKNVFINLVLLIFRQSIGFSISLAFTILLSNYETQQANWDLQLPNTQTESKSKNWTYSTIHDFANQRVMQCNSLQYIHPPTSAFCIAPITFLDNNNYFPYSVFVLDKKSILTFFISYYLKIILLWNIHTYILARHKPESGTSVLLRLKRPTLLMLKRVNCILECRKTHLNNCIKLYIVNKQKIFH